jgi:hypothetical protein
MRSKKAKAALAAAAVALAGTGLFATATTASAAPKEAPKAGYNGQCGSGYSVVNSAAIGDTGNVYLTYNASTGKNCVVTVRKSTGDPIHMSASIRALTDQDTKPVVEEGDFTSYAGPVYVEGKGHCIEWGGAIQDQTYSNDGSNCGSQHK